MSATTALAPAPNEPAGATTNEKSVNEAVAKTAAAGETVRADGAAPTPSPEPAENERVHQIRDEAAARLRQSTALPPALRDRLVSVVENFLDTPTDGRPQLPLEDCLKAIEESLPDFLRQSRAPAARPPHPSGDAFFTGNQEQITDARAELLAREQLSRSGLLRGQRVRVAE